MSRKSAIFTQIPVKKVKRNLFELGHEVKMSGKFGYLYPILLIDALPGDTIREQMLAMVRFAPMLAPIMHRCDVKTDFFFVPNRLVNSDWEEFITGGQDGNANVIMPYVTPRGIVDAAGDVDGLLRKGTLWDYMGLPVMEGAALPTAADYTEEKVSVMPFRAYQKVYNDYYRDPNLDQEVELDISSGADQSTNYFSKLSVLQRRGWERDYFTAALPWAQRGAEVMMPLAGTGQTIANNILDGDLRLIKNLDGSDADAGNLEGNVFSGDTYMTDVNNNPISIVGQKVELTSSGVSINDFRRTLAIQSWMENNARGGGRYIEQIEAHFSVRVPDYRLQRAEYLGGGRQPVEISQVLSTADTDDVPVGDMAGHGISVGKSNRFTYRCQEHGYILGIMSITFKTAYDQGIERHWSRENKFDFGWTELANLGEQEIINREVFLDFNATGDGDGPTENGGTFGYIPRYAEYKFKQDRLAGDFRDTLSFWHLSRIFTARPSLDSEFLALHENNIAAEETYRRIFANQDGTDYIWIQLFHNITAKRPLPYFGVPQLNG